MLHCVASRIDFSSDLGNKKKKRPRKNKHEPIYLFESKPFYLMLCMYYLSEIVCPMVSFCQHLSLLVNK